MAAAAEKTLSDLFEDTLRDTYYAEKQILKTAPKMAKAAPDPALKAGFEKHIQKTEGHIDRVEQVFEIIGKTFNTILGIFEEGKLIIKDFKGTVLWTQV
jgi:ferritin-like metal-binding protein YciE